MQHAQEVEDETRSRELEYEVTGAGEPVLMISPVLADGFQPLVSERALTDRCQLITYHKRGWGGSTRTPPPVTMVRLTRPRSSTI